LSRGKQENILWQEDAMEYQFITRIENELKKQKITAKKMLLELGYSDSLITKWKKGSEPSATKLIKIAEYLNIDIGYIITGQITTLTEQEKELLNNWQELDLVEQEVIQNQINTLIQIKKKKNSKLSS
jgi:transcriptional regulator with XRE-family HTH domain